MDGEATSGIDVIIPNWNGRAMLAVCLDSLSKQTCRDFNVIVVDNGSSDDSVEYLHRNHPEVQVVSFAENRGFSAAVNEGIRSGEREYVLLLNNDTELEQQCLKHLLETAQIHRQYEIFAPKMLSYHHRTVLDGAGDGVLRGGVGYRFGTLENDTPNYALKREVFGACAGAALYRRSLFQQIGCFDQDFFAYLEDVDFNMRAVQAGYRCLFLPEAVVFHIGSASTGSKVNKFTVRLSTRNNIFVIAKNYPLRSLIRFMPALLVYQFFWLLFVLKKRQFLAYCSGAADSLPQLWRMRKKHHLARKTAVLTAREFGDKVVASEREVIKSIMSRREQNGKTNVIFKMYLAIFC